MSGRTRPDPLQRPPESDDHRDHRRSRPSTTEEAPAIHLDDRGVYRARSTATAVAPVIRLEDVSFYYGAFRAVKDITIDVPTHRITALIGPSGCGKSTLLPHDQPDE